MTRNVSNVPQRKCTLCLHERPETLYQGSSTVCAYCEADKRTNNEFAIKKRRRESPEMVQKAVEEKARSDEHLTEAQKKAKETLAIRQLSRRRLLPFVEQSKPRYLAGWVHKDICQRLERFEQDVLAQKSPRLMLFMPPRHGKSCENKVLVLTQNRGWTTHGELVPGDFVFHPSGKPVEVLAVSDEHQLDCVIETSDGATIKCHENHEWTIYDRTYAKTRTVETKWFMATTKFGGQRKLDSGPPGKRGHRYKFQIDRTGALEFPEVDLPLPPYFIGAWLGDGLTSRPSLCASQKDAETLMRCAELVGAPSSIQVHKDTGVVYHYFSGLIGTMRSLGLIGHKHIPMMYQQASIEQRMQLLAGLIDTDGSVEPDTGRVRIVTSLPGLADDIVQLLRGLGFVPRVCEAAACTSSSGVIGRNIVYTISFYPDKPVPTVLPRKQIKHMRPNERIAITAVRRTEDPAPGKCIQVDSPDGLYLVGRELTPTHNSQIASIDFPAWFLGRNPELEIIASSYSASLAVGFSRKVRAQLRSPEYHAIFPKAHLDPDAQSADGWALLEGGGYVPAGVNGPVTGKGAHVFIIDDPVKNREEAESVVQRTNVLDWYTSTAYTRLAPGGGILLIMTRWHSVDLAGALIEAQKDGGDEWEIISYPAIATEDEEFRKAGEALHPERYNIENLQRIKRAIISVSGERDWEALYQQAPVSEEGDYFRRSDIKFYKPEDIADKPLRYYAAWDFAIGKKERNDYSVGLVVGVDQDDNIYIVDRIRGRFSGYDLVEKILDLYVKWKPSIVGLEKGMIEMSIGAFLEKRIAERRLWEIYLEELKPGRRDKEARARAIQGRIQQGKVFFPEKEVFTEALIKEMLFFPNGEHDDQVDALAWIGHMLAVFVGVRDEPEEKKKSWRDKLEKALQGGDTRKRSAMSA